MAEKVSNNIFLNFFIQ